MLGAMRTRSRLQNLSRSISRAVDRTLEQIDPEVDRLLVGSAVVVRSGEHFRIERGGESCEELEIQALRLQGRCECGGVLCVAEDRARCPRCAREFRS